MFDAAEREKAQNAIRSIRDSKGRLKLTTSKIRKLLTMVTDIYNETSISGEWNERLQSKMEYLVVRIAYESGRDKTVKIFINNSKLMERAETVNDRPKFMDFHKYLEALVAYHRFYGGEN
jgi:CRISPR-associated protein Csm2